MLEQLPLTDRYRGWVSAVSQLFGGLDICALEAVVGKDGKEHIIEVNDSALTLMGDSQEEDRRHIAELVCAKMQVGEWERIRRGKKGNKSSCREKKAETTVEQKG